jgi:hypothetical protein
MKEMAVLLSGRLRTSLTLALLHRRQKKVPQREKSRKTCTEDKVISFTI